MGGRVHTIRSFQAGQIAEAGGEFIDTRHAALLGYVHHFGLTLDDLRTTGSDLPEAAYTRGRRLPRYRYLTARARRDMQRYEAAIAKLGDPLDPANPIPGQSAVDRRTAASLIDSLDLPPQARWLIDHEAINDEYTVSADRLSLLALVAAEAVGPSLPPSSYEAFRIHDGNDQVPAALAATLGPRVHLSSPVRSIDWSDAGVRVTTPGGTVAARHCVIATSLPPLRAVRFRPALTPRLAAAIAELQYGSGTKTLLQYRRRFWIDQGFGGDTVTDLPVSTTWAATNAQPGEAGILLAYTVGPGGRRFGSLGDQDRVQAAAANSSASTRAREACCSPRPRLPGPGSATPAAPIRPSPQARSPDSGGRCDVRSGPSAWPASTPTSTGATWRAQYAAGAGWPRQSPPGG